MHSPINIPLVMRNVKIAGPKGSLQVDMILDTGAAFTVLSWSDLKVIGYDPAVVPERQEIITANGVIEVPKLRIDRIAIGDVEARFPSQFGISLLRLPQGSSGYFRHEERK